MSKNACFSVYLGDFQAKAVLLFPKKCIQLYGCNHTVRLVSQWRKPVMEKRKCTCVRPLIEERTIVAQEDLMGLNFHTKSRFSYSPIGARGFPPRLYFYYVKELVLER